MKTKILSLLISLSLLACSERENKPTNVRSTLSRAEALMTQAPDSALMLLEDLSKGALRGRAKRAHGALLYSQALD
ncbi:MAG: tetratricopeptide repeat protein, partial [Bacteroidales bacterium]|nr:tetratricopeptide repeat protein [Bacteroidales bacterium]